MTEIIIPHGGGRDGWIWLSVNGEGQWVRADKATDLDDSELEVLNHAMISYTLPNGTEPLIFSDFKNGVYTIDGASAVVTDIWTSDAQFGPFTPGIDITAGVGLNVVDAFNPPWPVMVPALSADLVGNCTMVVQTAWKAAAEFGLFSMLHVNYPDDDEEFEFVYKRISSPTPFRSQVQSFSFGDNVTVPQTLTSNRFAFTFTPTGMAASVNGGEVQEFATTPLAVLNRIVMDVEDSLIVEEIGFYPTQDNIDLPTLSAL